MINRDTQCLLDIEGHWWFINIYIEQKLILLCPRHLLLCILYVVCLYVVCWLGYFVFFPQLPVFCIIFIFVCCMDPFRSKAGAKIVVLNHFWQRPFIFPGSQFYFTMKFTKQQCCLVFFYTKNSETIMYHLIIIIRIKENPTIKHVSQKPVFLFLRFVPFVKEMHLFL